MRIRFDIAHWHSFYHSTSHSSDGTGFSKTLLGPERDKNQILNHNEAARFYFS